MRCTVGVFWFSVPVSSNNANNATRAPCSMLTMRMFPSRGVPFVFNHTITPYKFYFCSVHMRTHPRALTHARKSF